MNYALSAQVVKCLPALARQQPGRSLRFREPTMYTPEERTVAQRESHQRWYAAHRTEILAKAKAYQASHKAERRAYNKKLRARHKCDGTATYYALHRSERMAYSAAYNATHRKEHREYYRTHLAEISEKRKALARRYRVTPEGKEQHAAAQRKRRALKLKAREVSITSEQWRKILLLAKGRCYWCRRAVLRLTQDHVIPLSKGGLHSAENVVASCVSCNCKKGAKIVTLF